MTAETRDRLMRLLGSAGLALATILLAVGCNTPRFNFPSLPPI